MEIVSTNRCSMHGGEVVSLNLADLDVADLQQRVELAALAMPAGCGLHCDICGAEW